MKVGRGRADSVAFSLDGRFLATDKVGENLVLWDVGTGKEARRMTAWAGAAHPTFALDGRTLAASVDGAIGIWELSTGRLLPLSGNPLMKTTGLRFGRAGQLYGSSDTVIAWDPANGRELHRLPDIRRHYGPIVLSPDEKLLAHSDQDGTIRLFDALTGKEVGVLKGHENWCYPLVFTQDSRFLVSGGYDSTARIWEVASGKERHRLLGHRGGLHGLAVSTDGHWLASSASDGARGDYDVRLWDLRTGKEERRFKPARGSVFALAFSPDGLWLAGVGGLPGRLNDRGDVQVWEVGTGKERRSMNGHQERVTCVTFSPDGRMLATGSVDKTARLWEGATGKERQQFRHDSMIDSIAFSPDGKRLGASSSDAPLYVWDVAGVLEARKLSDQEAEKAWAELASADAPTAFQALRRLAADPERAMPVLRQRLQPVKPVDGKELEQLAGAPLGAWATRGGEAGRWERTRTAGAAAGQPTLRRTAKGGPAAGKPGRRRSRPAATGPGEIDFGGNAQGTPRDHRTAGHARSGCAPGNPGHRGPGVDGDS